jgi:hypothetical protein
MLNVDVRAHRPYLRASAGGQKLFLMLKLLPSPEAVKARPDVSIAVVVDTSGSMREPAPGTTPELIETAPVIEDSRPNTAGDAARADDAAPAGTAGEPSSIAVSQKQQQ